MKLLVKSLFLLVALVNLIPTIGVLSADQLSGLYGLAFDEPNLEILMRHRAVLFGIVGGLLVLAAFKTEFRQTAVICGLVSMMSFVVVAWLVGDYNPQIARVVAVDIFASAALIAAVVVSRFAESRLAEAQLAEAQLAED